MLSAASILALGFVLGMRHATDPDHVVAVTTIVAGDRSVGRASRIGALWGVGHTATILVVGAAIILFGLVIPPRLGLAMEFAVAMMLIGLGVMTLSGRGATGKSSSMRPMLVGLVHGLAGSAFVAMLVLTTIPTPSLGVAYLLIFGVGTVAGMALITTAIAVPSAWGAGRFSKMQRYVQVGAGVVSVCFGLYLAHQVGLVDGLFTANPSWSPQ
jgi:high-affinity nickel permease